MTAPARYLTARQLAEQLGITTGALYQMRRRGTAPKAVKRPGRGQGRKLLFTLDAIKAWEQENTA